MLLKTKIWNHCDIYQFTASNFLGNFRVIFVTILVFHILPDLSKTKNLWEVRSLSLMKDHQRDFTDKMREHPIFHFVWKFSTITVSHLELSKSVSDLTRHFSSCFLPYHENIQQLFFALFHPICILIPWLKKIKGSNHFLICILIFLRSRLSMNRLVITQILSKVITSQWLCPFKDSAY